MSIEKLKKRDGRLVDFDETKIAAAINKAFEATYKPGYEEVARDLARDVVSVLEVEGVESPDVEHVQDIVEKVLMDSGYVQTAKAYILYRNERSRAREMNTRLMKVYEDITFSDAVDSDVKRENANVNADTAMGAMLKYGSEGAKQFYQMFLLKPEHAKAHREGDIHIHDLDFYALTTTCCQIDLIQLFNDTKEKRDKFTIVSFSIDNKEKAWHQAIAERGMNLEGWIHASDLKGWQSEQAQMFGVEAVPHTVLISPEGRVISFNLRGEEMVRTVKQLLEI